MKQKILSSYKLADFIIIAASLIFVSLFFLIGLSGRKIALLESERLAMESSKKAAGETQNYLASAFHVTRTFANSAKILHKNKINRNILIDMMMESIRYDSSFLAVWLMWEPNLYDGLDSKYAGSAPYDSIGSLAVTYYWSKGEIKTEINEPEDFLEDFYVIPRKERKEIITEPYLWNYTGTPEWFFETSVITPIIIDSVFHGVFAVDLDFGKLQKMHNEIKIYKSGFVSLISNGGIMISSPDTAYINKNVSSVFNPVSLNNWEKRSKTEVIAYETISEFTGKKVFRFINPLIIGNTNEAWYMLIEIPKSEIKANSNRLLFTSFLMLVVGIVFMVYLLLNLNKRKKYEKQLTIERNKALESEKLKSAFLANISHEVRTPMNGIIGFSELLREQGNDTKRNELLAERIIECSYRLLDIMNDVLDISLIQTSEIKINDTLVNIRNEFQDISEYYKKQANQKGIRLVYDEKISDDRAFIVTDIDKIRRIVKCLLDNALKFTHVGYVRLKVYTHDEYLQFEVEDSGVGIPHEMQEKIFENFRQVELEFSRQYGGTGLGLSIAKKMVELLGGKIWLRSELNVGSSFFFSIPYKSANGTSDNLAAQNETNS